MIPYKTLLADEVYSGELVEKKSRFIAALTFVDTADKAAAFLASEKKKYYDAKHHCSAYIIKGEDGAPDIVHSSDDGEPSGTAGRPILDVISGAGLKNVVLVVTRYFGGTLLGTGGLVRAYSGAAADAVTNADIVEMRPMLKCEAVFDYAGEPKVRRIISDGEYVLVDTEYTDKVKFFRSTPPEKADELKETLVNTLAGNGTFETGDIEFSPVMIK